MASTHWGRTGFLTAAATGLVALGAAVATWSPEDRAGPADGVAVVRPAAVASPPGQALAPLPAVEPVATSTRRQRFEDRRTHVTVVGDAFSTGSTLEGRPTWPTRLGRRNAWEVRVVARDDAGYVVGGGLLGERAQRRLERYPADLVIVAGGAADLAVGAADLADDVARTVRQVRTALPDSDVLLLSPFSARPPTSRTVEMSDSMRRVADRAGVGYLDVSRVLTRYPGAVSGGLPTPAGQRRMADAVDARLSARHWPRFDAWRDPDDAGAR